jgi:hypothetical protein
MTPDDIETRVRSCVAHGMEKSTLLRDAGGWPDSYEVTDQIDRMTISELLTLISIAVEERLTEATGEAA